MAKAILKSTNNPSMKQFVGLEGDLEKGTDGRFHFRFVDQNGKGKDLTSKVVSQLGDLDSLLHNEISFETKNSVYVFEKIGNVRDSLTRYGQASVDKKISEASSIIENEKKEAFHRMYGRRISHHNTFEKGAR